MKLRLRKEHQAKGDAVGFILWDKVDRKPVGASQPLYFSSEANADQHLARMPAVEVAAGRFAVLAVPE